MGLRYFICILTLSFACFFAVHVQGQGNNSSKENPANPTSDSERINMLTDLPKPVSCADADNQLSKTMEALVHAEKIQWTNGMITANNKCGNILFVCLGNYSSALIYYQASAALAHKAGDIKKQALALECAAKCYDKLGKHNKALEDFNSAMALEPGTDMEIGILGDMGLTYNTIGDYSNALSTYIKSLELLDKSARERKKSDLSDTLQRTGLLMNIGDIYQSMSQPDKALENYTNALKISRDINDVHLQIYSLIGIGFTYKIKKDYSKSIEIYNQALATCGPDDYREKSSILADMASVYLASAQNPTAMDKITEALQIATAHSYSDLLPKCYAITGKIYLAQNNYGKAAVNLEKALNIYHTNGELDDEKDTWEALSSAYEKTGDPAKALVAYKHFITIRDSIYNLKKANELTRIDLEFRYSRKQLENNLKQAGIYAKKIQRQRFITYAGFVGLAMVLLLMFIIYRSYVIQRKYNLLLSKEKKTHLAHIREQDTVLTDIAHIQSHRVRGPVATILGLAQLYNYEDANDPVNKDVIYGITTTTEELDIVVKEVITKENKLRKEK